MTVVHCKKDAYTVYIGRPSEFGNPFIIGVHGSRLEVIKKYEDYARAFPQLLNSIKKLPPNSVLGCWCKPFACHGDVIMKLWLELYNV